LASADEVRRTGLWTATVTKDEVDPREHRPYLDAVGTHSAPLGKAMMAMGVAAGTGARSLTVADCASVAGAMTQVRARATSFLDQLVAALSPGYLRGADCGLQDALKLLVDAGRRGAEGAIERDGAELVAAALEMDVANRDIASAAQRIANWRGGAARP